MIVHMFQNASKCVNMLQCLKNAVAMTVAVVAFFHVAVVISLVFRFSKLLVGVSLGSFFIILIF